MNHKLRSTCDFETLQLSETGLCSGRKYTDGVPMWNFTLFDKVVEKGTTVDAILERKKVDNFGGAKRKVKFHGLRGNKTQCP